LAIATLGVKDGAKVIGPRDGEGALTVDKGTTLTQAIAQRFREGEVDEIPTRI